MFGKKLGFKNDSKTAMKAKSEFAYLTSQSKATVRSRTVLTSENTREGSLIDNVENRREGWSKKWHRQL